MRYYWDLVSHFLKANSRHGTHSPFVYQLADEVIYRRAEVSDSAIAIPAGFLPRYAALVQGILVALGQRALRESLPLAPQEALWLEKLPADIHSLLLAVEQGHILVVHEPYVSSASKASWQALIQDPAVVVSLDLFHVGLVMARSGQRKEHFCLRYPY